MRKFSSVLAFALVAASAIPALSLASAATDQVVSTSSTQTYALTPGSNAYTSWSSWIKNEQAKPDVPHVVNGVGVITVTVSSATSNQAAMSVIMANNGAPTGQPPGSLPATGTPGQVYTISNRTPSGYQVWNYTWETTPDTQYQNGGGTWVLTSSGSCGNPNCGITITNPP